MVRVSTVKVVIPLRRIILNALYYSSLNFIHDAVSSVDVVDNAASVPVNNSPESRTVKLQRAKARLVGS